MTKEEFETLYQIDVNKKVEKKKSGGKELAYLSWAWAWAEFKKVYPNATYKIHTFKSMQGTDVPYMSDDIGYMVMTSVTVDELTHSMWLPVMDGANKAMLSQPYEYSTKYEKKKVEAASMFDINKTLMRCLVKNLAMFGLGLYIYAGEDLPEDTDNLPTPQENEPTGSNRQAIPDFTLEGEILSREEMKFYYSYQVLEPVKAIIANTLGDKKLGELTEVEQRKLTIEAREKYREIKGGK